MRRHAADDRAEQDRNEGRALDQRVAGRKLGMGEMIGQNSVFDRAEQSPTHSETEKREKEEADSDRVMAERVQAETQQRESRHADLGQLDPLRTKGLIVAVGNFDAKGRQKEVWEDEHRRRERDQHVGGGACDLEQDQKDERLLEEVVAERREKLGPEQRREAPRRQQGHWLLP